MRRSGSACDFKYAELAYTIDVQLSVDLATGRCYDPVVVDDSDRVAKVSDVKAATESLGAALRAELVGRIDGFEGRLVQAIREDGETRRHVASVMGQMHDSLKTVADGIAHNTAIVENHEKRLKKLEKAR